MIRTNLLTQGVTGLAIALTFSTSMTKPSLAQEPPLSFFCDIFQSNYATKVRTSKGNRAILFYEDWASSSGWTPKKRCQAVSSRFQNFYNQNLLKYMRSGKVKNYPVICVTPQKGTPCQENHVLITLEAGTNPQAALRSLVSQSQGDSSSGVSAMSYQEPTEPSYFSTDSQGNLYVNVEELIETAPVDERIWLTR
ncbi:MAG: COP23 domain-containing protein [Scytonema hyalinum WJT4-NPBG1]|jgi:hypothetical protein|nr:COP23 domain-containing protein [Scytonema hyalinum WJT4-NPBG1]